MFLANATILTAAAGIIWGTLYFFFDEVVAAAIPWSYGLLSLASLAYFAWRRHYVFFRFAQFTLILLLPFFLTVALGGFINSSAVILWSLVCTFGVLIIDPPRVALRWFLVYLGLVVATGIIHPILRSDNNISPQVTVLFFVMNIAAPSTVAFVLLYYFIGQVEAEKEKLESLTQTMAELQAQLELSQLLRALVSQAVAMTGSDAGYFATVDQNNGELRVEAATAAAGNGDGSPERVAGEQVLRHSVMKRQPVLVESVNDLQKNPREAPDESEDSGLGLAAMAVPLLTGERLSGAIVVLSAGAGSRYRPSDLNLLTLFATQAATAIENARLFEEVRRAREAADAANEAKSAFLANVSHELRTPLTSVLGFAKIIKKRLEGSVLEQIEVEDRRTKRAVKQVRSNIDIIITEGERLTTLINNVLDLAKIEAGKIEWHMELIAISDVIDRATTATAALFEQKNLSLVNEVEPELPSVRADKDKLIQVVINLISNAVKFTEEGTITCSAAQLGDEIVVRVRDTGMGISEADLPKVFEKFVQVGDTLTDKPRGTGLGLPICKEIVEHHNGRIWVESQLGHGSTFCFTLPVYTDGAAGASPTKETKDE